jgi:hypothetical protein
MEKKVTGFQAHFVVKVASAEHKEGQRNALLRRMPFFIAQNMFEVLRHHVHNQEIRRFFAPLLPKIARRPRMRRSVNGVVGGDTSEKGVAARLRIPSEVGEGWLNNQV